MATTSVDSLNERHSKGMNRMLNILNAVAAGMGFDKELTKQSNADQSTNSAVEENKNEKIRKEVFKIRSCEVGPSKRATIETMMPLLQEAAALFMANSGLTSDGIWTSPAMQKNNVTWVLAYIHVKVDSYPSWGDKVEVVTWSRGLGEKIGMHGEWVARNQQTGSVILRATSTWMMIDIRTRKAKLIPDDVWDELIPHFMSDDCKATEEDDFEEIGTIGDNAEHIRSGLSGHVLDLDMNSHLNNSKHVRWVLESIPISTLENYELSEMTLDFRKECLASDVVQSLCHPYDKDDGILQYTHMLRMLKTGSEMLRGRTAWRTKKM